MSEQEERGNLPSAIRKQLEEAEAALAAADSTPEDEGSANPEAPATVDTPANTKDDLLESTPQPAPVAEPEAPVETGKEKEKDDEIAKLRAQYAALRGKYDAEVPRLTKHLRDLEAQNDALKDELDAKAAEPREPVELSEDSVKKYLSEEERKELDDDVLGFQLRSTRGVAEDLVDQTVAPLDRKMRELEKTLSDLRQAQAASADAKFWTEVEVLAPGASEANAGSDPEWVAFLDGTDSSSGLLYREIGQAAVARGDAGVVANLFNLFSEKSAPEEPVKRRTAKSQVKPDTVSSATTTKEPQKPKVKESEIKTFYQQAAKSGMTLEQIAEKEAEFDLAASEGRIVFGK
jgi:hypothetical protein